MGFLLLLLLFPLGVVLLWAVLAFLAAGAERREHPWETWGLNEESENEKNEGK